MLKGRRQAKRETAHAREEVALEAAEYEHREAAERVAAVVRMARKWGSGAVALDRLSALSRELENVHREQTRLLRERDGLVGWLRRNDHSWTTISARTNLSRQALM